MCSEFAIFALILSPLLILPFALASGGGTVDPDKIRRSIKGGNYCKTDDVYTRYKKEKEAEMTMMIDDFNEWRQYVRKQGYTLLNPRVMDVANLTFTEYRKYALE